MLGVSSGRQPSPAAAGALLATALTSLTSQLLLQLQTQQLHVQLAALVGGASMVRRTLAKVTAGQLDSAFYEGEQVVADYERQARNAHDHGYVVRDPSADYIHQQATSANLSWQDEADAYLFCFATQNLVKSGAVSRGDLASLADAQLPVGSRAADAMQRCRAARGALPTCDSLPSNVYSFDGSCNHRDQPALGRVGSCHRRLAPPAYDDGVDLPRRTSVTGRVLANEREISLAAFNEILPLVDDDEEYNHNRMAFGQFLAHDISLTPTRVSDTADLPDCCNRDNLREQCYPIALPQPDQVYGDRGCMNFVRSLPCLRCSLGPREQMNAVTPFVDLSNIYGVSEQQALRLRSLEGGKLRGQLEVRRGRRFWRGRSLFLPATERGADGSDSCSQPGRPCFDGGDPLRVNQQIGIVAWTTLWFRYHNYLADRIRWQHEEWSDERIYQTARRIAQAHMQLVTYREWLPTVIGEQLMDEYDLNIGRRTDYDSSVDPNMWSEFATGAFRFGHSLIQDVFENRDSQAVYRRRSRYDVDMRDAFSSVPDYYDFNTPFTVENFVAGMYRQPGKQISFSFAPGVAQDVYRTANESHGLDLAALNIRRGRDHGVQPYYVYAQQYIGRAVGGSVSIERWSDVAPYWRRGCVRALSRVYADVRDVDLYVGGLCERPLERGTVGPTFGHIIALQMRELRFGDRLFVSHRDAFTADQYRELRETGNLASIICATAVNQRLVLTDAFRYTNTELVRCWKLYRIDTTMFDDILD